MLRHLAPIVVLSCAMLCPTPGLRAQATPPVSAAQAAVAPRADSVAAMAPFARANVALNALRERADAEYAEPKNKKPEVLTELRNKYRIQREQVLKGQGLTEASFGKFTQRISSDDAARIAFEAALARLSAK